MDLQQIKNAEKIEEQLNIDDINLTEQKDIEKNNETSISNINNLKTDEDDGVVAIKKRLDKKQLGKGTYGFVIPVDFIYGSGKKSPGALKTMFRQDPISGFGNLQEIEMSVKFGGVTCSPQVLIIDIAPYYFKRRDGSTHNEFLSIGTKRAHCDAAEFAQRGGYTIRDVLRMSVELFSALKYMHTRNICHRDIKPGNMLIYIENGVPSLKITDFGFACNFSKTSPRSPNVNTAEYRAPEIVCRKRDYKKNSDIWSAGCLLYELATGVLLLPNVSDKQTMQVFFENLLTTIPTEWTVESQAIYRADGEFANVEIFGSKHIRQIPPIQKSFLRQFRTLQRYKHEDELYWRAMDRILNLCFEYNYKVRHNACNILSDECFNLEKNYVALIAKQQDRPQSNDEIIIKISPEINKRKCEFFTEAYERFVKNLKILSPRAVFHALDLANIFLTNYQETEMNLDNVFSCCLYLFNKSFSISVLPAKVEKFFWKTFPEHEILADERKLMELDKLVYDFECVVIDKDKMVGFKTYRPNLFEMQDHYNHTLSGAQLYLFFQEFCSINEWKEKSFRYMYRLFYNKLVDPNFRINT